MTDMGRVKMKLRKGKKLSRIKPGQAIILCERCGTAWVFNDSGEDVTYTFNCPECKNIITYISYGPIEGIHYGDIKTRKGVGGFLRKLPRRIKNR